MESKDSRVICIGVVCQLFSHMDSQVVSEEVRRVEVVGPRWMA